MNHQQKRADNRITKFRRIWSHNASNQRKLIPSRNRLLLLLLITLTVSLLVSTLLLALLPAPPLPRTLAATPSSGEIGPTPGSSVNWAGPLYAVQSTAVPEACAPVDPLNSTCDHYSLTVNRAGKP